MELPQALKSAIEQMAEGVSRAKLTDAAGKTSERYREGLGRGTRLVTTDIEAAAYAAARMPATFGAVSTALRHALALVDIPENVTLTDVGAGTGAGSWAAAEEMSLSKVTCLEREKAMRDIGSGLMKEADDEALANADWREFDLTADVPIQSADVVLASYVLNELKEADRLKAAERLFEAAGSLLLIVEPGTPEGWKQLMQIRDVLIAKGAHIAAPCPHMDRCPITEGDWCHFTCRIARSRLHKALKTGDAPYEDEKFSYLALTKAPAKMAKGRVVRHPVIEPGRITLKVCGEKGIEQLSVRKKDAMFKWARKASCGDALPE